MIILETGQDHLTQLRAAQSETLSAVCVKSGTMFGED